MAQRFKREPPVILVDTREQTPYSLVGVPHKQATMKVGDYALEGHEFGAVVERKTMADAYGCVGRGRARFERCLIKLAACRAPCIIIEASLSEFSVPPPYTKLTAAHAVGSFVSWACQHRIPTWFAGSREAGERIMLRWLTAYWKHRGKDEYTAAESSSR